MESTHGLGICYVMEFLVQKDVEEWHHLLPQDGLWQILEEMTWSAPWDWEYTMSAVQIIPEG